MKKWNLFLLAGLLTWTGCNPTEDAADVVKNEIKVKVCNTKSWDPLTKEMAPALNAVVSIVSGTKQWSALTNYYGEATFSDVQEGHYVILASQGELSTLVNKTMLSGKTIGNLIIGIYTSQKEIDESPKYTNAIVGGIKLADINGDGRIDNYDLVEGNSLKFEYQYEDLNGDSIIDVKDLSDGKLVRKDSQMEKVVYIGQRFGPDIMLKRLIAHT